MHLMRFNLQRLKNRSSVAQPCIAVVQSQIVVYLMGYNWVSSPLKKLKPFLCLLYTSLPVQLYDQSMRGLRGKISRQNWRVLDSNRFTQSLGIARLKSSCSP